VLTRQNHRCACCDISLSDGVEFDHRPPLRLREVDATSNDYLPPQDDPDYIDALTPECHQRRTTGRKQGALRTVTTLGSDAHTIAKIKRAERRFEGSTSKQHTVKIRSRGFEKDTRRISDGAKRAWPKGRKISPRQKQEPTK
jgi:hypothetical protein